MNKAIIHNQNKNKKLLVTSIAIVVALALVMSPIMDANDALASHKKHGNKASQSISQSQFSNQNSEIVSGGDSIGSGNNFNFQNQEIFGNNVLAQD